jgi:RHS repeat-associated protein
MVQKGVSPLGYDMVAAELYDSLGREVYKYMPYTSPSNDGNFKTNPFTEQNTFLSAYYNPTSASNGEKFFYSQTVYEASPLNRTLNTYPEGNSWAGSAVGTSMQYAVSTPADSVVIWRVTYTPGLTPTSSGFYAYGQLLKTVAIDERGNQVVEYKDKDGHSILKKVQIATSPSTGHTGWLCTYYVYDDLGNLRFVMQPNAVQALQTASWAFDGTTYATSSIAKGLCFSYEYDLRNRVTIKRVPGAGEIWLVYDARDRLVMTQDSGLRAQGNWLYTQYDSLNRSVITGIWASSGNQSYQQGLASTSVSYPNPTSGYTVLTQTWYDNYTLVNADGSGLSTSLITTNVTNNFATASDNTFPYPRNIVATNLTNGEITGTKVNIVGTSTYLYTVHYYDDRGRLIQVHSTNISGGMDTATTQYGFTGRALATLVGHGKRGANSLSYAVLTKDFFDAEGRVLAVTETIGSSLQDTVMRSQYDETGHLALKKLGQTRSGLSNWAYTANPVDTLRYTYNIRGWLRGINKDYANAANSASNWFGMELNYDYGFSQNQVNGNIAGIKWRQAMDGAQRAYGFTYDAANRLTEADFRQYTNSTWNLSAGLDFSTHSIAYDNNGNILGLNQMGVKINVAQIIDSLLYGYNPNSNQLNYVTDRANDTSAHLGDFTEINNNSSQDYTYDGNGNLTTDNNKAIGNIHYNYLNLPDSITFTSKGYIKYVYDASGTRQQKIVVDNVANKKTAITYIKGFVYQYTAIPSTGNGLDTLQFVAQEEGRARPKNIAKADTMFFDFFEKDHLGNTRVLLTDQPEQDFYPAATLENNSSSFNMLTTYYTINPADTISVNRIASWSSTVNNNYPNNNGNPPYNTDPYVNTTATSNFVYRLNGATGDKTGLGITLKVMTGDVVDIYGKSFWHNNGAVSNNYPVSAALSTFIGLFAGTPGVTGSGHGAATAISNAINNSTSDVGNIKYLLDTSKASTGGTPRAYINWILFDENFNPIRSGSGFDLINTTADNVKSHHSTVSIGVSGFLYVYCSNESNNDVFFDNLQVVQTRGPLLENNSYYPFGLAMAGISDRAAKTNYSENKYRFNGRNELQNKEFSDGSGLELYDAVHRMYDPQIGRFAQLDELGEVALGWSPYSFSFDNPIRFNDPLGLLSDSTHPQVLPTVVVTARHTRENLVRIYWGLKERGVDFSRVKDKGLANWLWQYDDLQQWLSALHAKQREQEEEWLEWASWLIPVPGLGEIKIVGKLGQGALKLLKLKRGVAIVEAGSHIVYQGIDKVTGAVKYIGITGRSMAEREAEHLAATGTGREVLEYRVVEQGLSKQAARVAEQKLINEYGLGKNGGQLLNKINSIAEKHWAANGINK